MKQLGVGYTGTVTKNRIGNCPVGKEMATKRGSLDFMTDKNTKILVCCWNDNKFVNYLISFLTQNFCVFLCKRSITDKYLISLNKLKNAQNFFFFCTQRK